jgi:hypothetical protein
MKLYSVWIDDEGPQAYNGSYQDWTMERTIYGMTIFIDYHKYIHTLTIL